MIILNRFTGLALAAAVAVGGPAVLTTLPTPAMAQATAADKALVDQAKAAGQVGEQSDGYLGFVKTDSGDAALKAAVAHINAGRAAAYRDAAAKAGVSEEAAGEAAAKLLIARAAPGQHVRTVDGTWVSH